MPYTVVDDDTCLQIRASIEYTRPDELQVLIETLQRRLTKMEIPRERPAEPVRALQAQPASGDTGPGSSGPNAQEAGS